jgi:hypothetical protein
MSQTSHLKATALTNLDAQPILEPNPGAGGEGLLRHVDGFVTTVANDATGTTYQLCRVPSNAVVKRIQFASAAQGAGAVELGWYYSTSLHDGTAASNQNSSGAPKAISAAFVAAEFSIASAVALAGATDGGALNATGNTAYNLYQEPLWQMLALATDPGGKFDFVATVNTTAITTGAALIYGSVEWTI